MALNLGRNFQNYLVPSGRFSQENKRYKELRGGGSYVGKGMTVLDPGLAKLREERLGMIRSGLGQFREGQSSLRARLEGNRGAYRQARLRPIQEARAQAQRGFARRGLSGSTLMQSGLAPIDQQIAEQSSLAEQETIGQLNQMDLQLIGAIFQASDAMGAEGRDWANQELGALGMSMADAERMRAEWENFAAGARQQRSNIFSAIGKIMGGVSGMTNASANMTRAQNMGGGGGGMG